MTFEYLHALDPVMWIPKKCNPPTKEKDFFLSRSEDSKAEWSRRVAAEPCLGSPPSLGTQLV